MVPFTTVVTCVIPGTDLYNGALIFMVEKDPTDAHLGVKRRPGPVYDKASMRAVVVHTVLCRKRASLQDLMELLTLMPAWHIHPFLIGSLDTMQHPSDTSLKDEAMRSYQMLDSLHEDDGSSFGTTR